MEASFQATTMMEMHVEGGMMTQHIEGGMMTQHVEGGMMTQHVAHKTPPRVPPKPTSRSPPSFVSKVTGGRQQSPSPVRHVKGPTPAPVRYAPPPSSRRTRLNEMFCFNCVFLCRSVSPSSRVSSFQIKPVRSPVMSRKQVRTGPGVLDSITEQYRV